MEGATHRSHGETAEENLGFQVFGACLQYGLPFRKEELGMVMGLVEILVLRPVPLKGF